MDGERGGGAGDGTATTDIDGSVVTTGCGGSDAEAGGLSASGDAVGVGGGVQRWRSSSR